MTAAPSAAQAERRRLAVRRALELIARRRRTEVEVRSALARDFAVPDVDHAVERLRSLGYIDDAGWAADYIARDRARQRAASVLRRELLARGVGAEDAACALRDHDDIAAALRAGRSRLRALGRLEPARRARRLRDHLVRRGFGRSLVESTLIRLGEDLEAAD